MCGLSVSAAAVAVEAVILLPAQLPYLVVAAGAALPALILGMLPLTLEAQSHIQSAPLALPEQREQAVVALLVDRVEHPHLAVMF